MARCLAVFVLGCVVFGGGQVQAFVAPDWRGQPGSTYQEWQFGDDSNPAAPDVVNNAYGQAGAAITVSEFGSGWLQQLPGMGTLTGYWDIGPAGQIAIDIDNRPEPLPYKEIWVQVVSFVDITQLPSVDVPGASMLGLPEETVVEHVETGGDWMLSLTKWRIEPNPDHEQVLVTADPAWGAVIDSIAIDTICVPEPTTCALLLLAATWLARRRSARA